MGLSFCYLFYSLLSLYPHLCVTQPPLLLLLLLLLYIFCLPSSFLVSPQVWRYSSSNVLFWFRLNQSLSFCVGWASAFSYYYYYYYIFCLPSSWPHPKPVRYLSSIVFFLFRFNQSFSFCRGGPQLLLFFLPSSWPLPVYLHHLASVIIIILHPVYLLLGLSSSLRIVEPQLFLLSPVLLLLVFLLPLKKKRDGCSYCTDTK